jgi:hypothetical protein
MKNVEREGGTRSRLRFSSHSGFFNFSLSKHSPLFTEVTFEQKAIIHCTFLRLAQMFFGWRKKKPSDEEEDGEKFESYFN